MNIINALLWENTSLSSKQTEKRTVQQSFKNSCCNHPALGQPYLLILLFHAESTGLFQVYVTSDVARDVCHFPQTKIIGKNIRRN